MTESYDEKQIMASSWRLSEALRWCHCHWNVLVGHLKGSAVGLERQHNPSICGIRRTTRLKETLSL